MTRAHLRRITGLVVGIGVACWVGCGQRIDAPHESPFALIIPPPDSYVQLYERLGFDSATDLDLARGGLLYVSSMVNGVTPFYQSVLRGPGWPFEDLVDPAVVAEAPNGDILVGDRGDMHVKVYEADGGAPRVTFTDSLWAEFGGIAADDSGNIYVADAESSFVRAYRPDGTPRFSGQHLADRGFGLGHVMEPHGLFFDGEDLWIADTGKNWVQKVSTREIQLGLAFLDGYTHTYVGQDSLDNTVEYEIKISFSSPMDVATDTEGFVYVADRGNRRIFKFDDKMASFTMVNYDTLMSQPPGLRAIGVSDTRVYAIDDSLGAILVWELK